MLKPLRSSLDFMPSPVEDRPGLLIRDPFHYSDATLIIPPTLVEFLAFFDGEHSSLDLKEALVRRTGQLDVSGLQTQIEDTLSEAGFLEDDRFLEMKRVAEERFAEDPVREAAHAGSGYPDDPAELRQVFDEYLGEAAEHETRTLAIAAPHVSPFGGVEAYRAGYRGLSRADAERTFVVLGTSHYGQPDRLGLTRKPYATPYGTTRTDLAMIDELERNASPVLMEDYCHSVEHSIEFQVVFLQHLYGPRVKVVPILCGSYAESIYGGGLPEKNDDVRRMLGALGEIAARRDDLLWVLGVDMAHMGARYGDRMEARADEGEMLAVEARDRGRIERAAAGDAQGFWELVQENRDDLKWCGSAPFYAFLRAVPQARGLLRHYQQWNIDEASVVSFAGMRFS